MATVTARDIDLHSAQSSGGVHIRQAHSTDSSSEISATKIAEQVSGKATKDSASEVYASIPPLGVPGKEKRFWFQRDKTYDPNAIATQPSVFDDPLTVKEYWPPSTWENIHRFDPLARWTWGEEHKLIRKIDLKITVWACIMFMALELDRANINQALTDNFLKDLHMDTNDYNLGNTVFKLAFLCSELPSQLVSKWVGPDRWIPAQMTLWSVVACSQFWLTGRQSFLVCRALLGILQGGFIPDIILYLSYFYKHHELSLRLGFFWTAMSAADILAAFLAVGLLQMRGVQGYSGWRWLFMIEGLLTLVLGIAAFVLMPASPTQTASKLRGKNGWFTEREEIIIINRVIREDPSKSEMHNRQPITPKLLFKGMCDYDMWPLYILGLMFQLPESTPQQYMTLTLRGLGFDTFKSNLLVIPYTVMKTITMMAMTYGAEIFGELSFIASIGQFWVLPFVSYLYAQDINKIDKWDAFGVMTAFLSYPSAHPLQTAWTSRNANGVSSRTISAALYNMFHQASGIISANIYRKDDAPRYRRGNRVLVSLCVVNIGLYTFTKVYYVMRNRSREKKWNALGEEGRLNYLATTKDEGNKRLDFRFAH
ncbi:hypothetical protein HYFRA_00011281 [Hymenoscyphus fraxineus]|uniref:MFS general substrate transporter n=1 Tax=Hymenoscyphus fraxineus TaxID=746836 RepID=A0A9N9KXI2_9HELO|nr:hypothetical protein HYFRA_00011281 [Hymenoscyphus fraxineus]